MCEFSYIKFYPSDYLADTNDLDATESGAYHNILCTLWLRRGELPLDARKLAQIAKVPMHRWKKVWASIERFFTIVGEKISQKRLSAELQRAREESERQREKAGKMWAGKRGQVIEGRFPSSNTKNPSSSEAKSCRSFEVNPLENNNVGDATAYAGSMPPTLTPDSNIRISGVVAPRATSAPRPDPTDEERARVAKKFESLGAIIGRLVPPMIRNDREMIAPSAAVPGYSEREVAALAKAFPHVGDMPSRLAGLLEWCAKQGIERENEAKKAIFSTLRKEAGLIALEAEKEANAA